LWLEAKVDCSSQQHMDWSLVFGGWDGGLWEWADMSCHSLVGSFKIKFLFLFVWLLQSMENGTGTPGPTARTRMDVELLGILVLLDLLQQHYALTIRQIIITIYCNGTVLKSLT
jgi:hypothetical protein